MRHLSKLLLLAVLAVAIGCSGGRAVTYNSTIDEVERPSDAAERYGEYTVSETDSSYVYEDELVRAGFLTSGGSVLMNVENKTDYSVQIRLEQGAFVMPGGSSERILTGGMSYASRNDQVQPITVPSGASTTTTLIPQSAVSMGQYGVSVAPMFEPDFLSSTGNETADDVEANVGETFSLLLPIEIQGNVNEYTFNFEVEGARIEGGRETEERTIGEFPSGS